MTRLITCSFEVGPRRCPPLITTPSRYFASVCPFRWPGGLGQNDGKGSKRLGAAAEAEGGYEEEDDDEDDAQDAMADVQGQQGEAPAHFGTLLSV